MPELEADQYLTIKQRSEGVFRDRGSKFIAIAIPVSSIDEAMHELALIRKEFHDARHHCYAYRLGPEGQEYRQNDDGEPSGTAGRPIFGQIQSFGLTNIIVIVIRYFGGTKLGTSGLIVAYKTSARDALEKSVFEVKTLSTSIELKFGYPLLNEVMRIVKDEDIKVEEQDFTLSCRMIIGIRMKNLTYIKKRLSMIYGLEISG